MIERAIRLLDRPTTALIALNETSGDPAKN
jgi:hypothetical protein